MKEERRHHFLLVLFGVVVFVALLHLSSIVSWIGDILGMIMPIIWGFIIAFILNVPMRGIERIIDKISNKKNEKHKNSKPMNLKLKRGISFSITILLLIVILTIVGIVVVPKMAESVVSIYELIMSKLPWILEKVEELGIDSTVITEWLNKLDLKEVISFISQKGFDLFDIIFNFVGSTLSGIVSLGISLVIAIYALLGKEHLVKGTKRFINAHLKEGFANYLLHFSELMNEKYAKFISGQCVESCILGLLMLIVLSLLKIPYASLIAVLTALCAFVPYIGAFLSCFIGAFLVMLVKPDLLIIYVIAYLVTQFIENQFIYPHVVGTSVGLNALWTILAVFVGGKLLGVFGMIFFIPLVAVLVTLINEYTDKKEQQKLEEQV